MQVPTTTWASPSISPKSKRACVRWCAVRKAPKTSCCSASSSSIARRAAFSTAGGPLDLPAREFEVLWELMSPPGRTVSKRALSDKLSSFDESLGDNALEAFISRLRKKLLGTGASIRTLRGIGYLLEAEV